VFTCANSWLLADDADYSIMIINWCTNTVLIHNKYWSILLDIDNQQSTVFAGTTAQALRRYDGPDQGMIIKVYKRPTSQTPDDIGTLFSEEHMNQTKQQANTIEKILYIHQYTQSKSPIKFFSTNDYIFGCIS